MHLDIFAQGFKYAQIETFRQRDIFAGLWVTVIVNIKNQKSNRNFNKKKN